MGAELPAECAQAHAILSGHALVWFDASGWPISSSQFFPHRHESRAYHPTGLLGAFGYITPHVHVPSREDHEPVNGPTGRFFSGSLVFVIVFAFSLIFVLSYTRLDLIRLLWSVRLSSVQLNSLQLTLPHFLSLLLRSTTISPLSGLYQLIESCVVLNRYVFLRPHGGNIVHGQLLLPSDTCSHFSKKLGERVRRENETQSKQIKKPPLPSSGQKVRFFCKKKKIKIICPRSAGGPGFCAMLASLLRVGTL